ncbi:radical SAM protein [Desulfogranum marinum]|uniref:radical SAM protein n=1 Tax=Desulfogranum marinum TaxID=453220 RepID=UPI001966A6F1|nr:radical SAM protein [Desulfogranum marinum]MBM9514814.1 radical SAM protein [Desulfogranum marinum]
MEACLIVTYRCNAKCYMCNTWKNPSRKNEEFSPELVDKLPADLDFINITGGEPFLRSDIEQIVSKALAKTKRLVISSNGYFTERITSLFQKFGNKIGIRVSIEGLPAANDELRGIKNGFDHGLRTLTTLYGMGIKDIGFGMTVSDRNADDMIELYRLASAMGLEFATATTHNSYYFHTNDNKYKDQEKVAKAFENIAVELLKTSKPKNWFRAYFNMGLARKARGQRRALPCEVGTDMFFVDPGGNVLPCNGSDHPMIMGNLHEQDFDTIWKSEQSEKIRQMVKNCDKQCWMIGSASPAMKKRIFVPLKWVAMNKLKVMKNKDQNICLDPIGPTQ